jgi:hypothetical protein
MHAKRSLDDRNHEDRPVYSGKSMFWRIVVSVAIAEALLCFLPIEVAGMIAVLRLWLFAG